MCSRLHVAWVTQENIALNLNVLPLKFSPRSCQPSFIDIELLQINFEKNPKNYRKQFNTLSIIWLFLNLIKNLPSAHHWRVHLLPNISWVESSSAVMKSWFPIIISPENDINPSQNQDYTWITWGEKLKWNG